MITYIFTYQREEMLAKLVERLDSFGLDYSIERDNIGLGKEGFWKIWDNILKFEGGMKWELDNELILFVQDDMQDLDIDRIKALHEQFKDKPYVYNIPNYGREGLFTGVIPYNIDEDTIMCGFTDCNFFCNKSALDKLGYYMEQTEVKEDSSGVGRALSMRFLKAKVPMMKPVKSLAFHGDHDSTMHPVERKKNPLISK